jgi:hypothetical protein
VKRTLLAAALAATTAIAVPIIARSGRDDAKQEAQTAQADEQSGEAHGDGPGHWMRGEGGPGMHGWRGMMMHRMMMHRDPKERCQERLARISQRG